MKNLVLNLRNAKAQAGCATSSRMAKLLTTLLFLTLGVGQMWASTTFADGDVLFYDFTAVTGGGGVNWQCNGSDMVYDPAGAGTIKCVIFTSSTTWTTSWTVAKTAKGSWAEIKFPSDRPSGKNCLKIDATGKTASWTTISLAEKVAAGDFIMVYGGELSSWSQTKYYFMSSNSTDATKALANANKSITINSQAYKFGPVALPSGTYYQGHWASGLSCAITAGSAYVVRGSGASTTYFTQKANSGSDYLYQVKKQGATSPTTSLSPTCPASIDAGSKLSFSHGAAGVSVLGRTNSVKYYLKNGSTYTEKTLSDGKIDVSDLAEGDYSIITLLYDGYIYVKASTSNFSVVTPASYSLTVEAGAHISTVTGSTDPITLGNSYSISASGFDTGYEFDNWTADPAGNASFVSSTSASTSVTVSNGSVTVTANAKEKKHNVTVYYKCGSTTIKTATITSNVGEVNTKNVSAPAISGYTFSNWTVGTGVTATTSTSSSPVSIKTKSSGTYSLTANYTEDLSTTWTLRGTFVDDFATAYPFTKKTGESAGSVAYTTVTLSANATYRFKVVNNGSTWYGNDNSEGGGTYYIKGTTENWTFETSKGDCYMTTTLAGTYTFKIDFSGSNPLISVYYPEVYAISGDFNSWTETSNMVFDGNVGTAVINITARAAVYEFKVIDNGEWSGGSHAITGTTSNLSVTVGGGDNMTIKADVYPSGDYTFTYNKSTHKLAVTYPTSYQISFDRVPTEGGKTAPWGNFTGVLADKQITSGVTKIADGATAHFYAANQSDGYTYYGWYTVNDAPKGTYTNRLVATQEYSTTVTSSTPSNLYATYYPKQCTVSFDYQLSTEGHGNAGTLSSVTATYDAAMPALTGNMPTAAEGYAFMGFFSETGGNGTKYYNADKSSAHNWDIDTESGTTLYAYYKKAEITGITFSPASAEPGDEVTATATISPTPSGTTTVCWEVRYASNDIPLSPQPTLTPASGASVTFTAPPAAVYKFVATLKTGNDCAAGTVLDTEDANLTVAGNHAVTIRYKHGDVVIKEETVENIHAVNPTPLSAPDIIGYAFSSWTLGDGISLVSGTTSSSSISVTAIYDGVITINYNAKRMIYFYNSLGWSSVNVYFYKNDSYWNNTNGTGANTDYTFTNKPYSEGKHGAMTNITGTNIWYFDAEGAGVNASYDDVVFTELDQHGYGYFAKTDDKQNKVVRRGDYKSSMPMFVPVEQDGVSMNGGLAIYYNEGYWMNYPENTGYTVRIYNAWSDDKTSPAREYYFPYSSDKKMPLKLDVEFNTTDAKWFSIYRNDGVYLGVNAEMTQASHTNYRIKDSNNKIKIQPSAPGIYTYTLTYYDDEEKDGSGKAYGNMYHITVDYPVSVGDYRILYKDNATWSQGTAHTASWCHPSDAVNKISAGATEAKKDTVSLFVSYGASPTAKFQYVSAINPSTGAVTWTDVAGGTINLSSITKSGTYNFIISQPVGGASVSVEKIEAYMGNYYIRTDCAGNTKWDNYRAADHQMTYSEFSCSEANSFGEKFSHYFTHWCPAGMNVKFVIANDYSSCISDTLIQDVGNTYANINSDGFLNSDGSAEETANRFSANIRFMYHEATNKISRAYVASSTNEARWFLVLRSNSAIHGQDDNPIEDIGSGKPSVILDDKQNWIYEQTLKILPGSKFKLFACYADVTPTEERAQYFRGNYASNDWSNSANTIELVGGTGDYQKVRVLYDFKTNRLVCAWLPDGDVSGDMDINADVMIIREHQEDATLITFATSSSKLTDVKTVYGTMKFNRWTLNNKSSADGHAVLPLESQKSIFERALYFISFPFDVNLGEVFGFGTYGVHWIIENYDGENRAKNGYWTDSPPNWKYVMSPKGYTLKANKGYILCLDLDQMKDDNEEFWPHGINTVELFFPSAVSQKTIEQDNVTIPAPDPAVYQCTINRPGKDGDRRVKDSYWRCLGVPSFANYTTTLSNGTSTITWQTADNTLPYLYVWNMEDNTLSAQSTSTFAFKTMHAYLTQCATAIVWSAASKPTPIAARYSDNEMLKDREFRLELAENDVVADQTYVRLSAREDVTAGFEFGNDMSKEMNTGKSNIYTFIGTNQAAANSLPLSTEQTTVVPVGVLANTAGDYTFSIPDGTDGIGITLVDSETGIRTQLGALDYTVTLNKGTYDERFYLEISPIHNTPTDLGGVNSNQPSAVRKVIIDQNMYIIRDGKMYNVQGARCN